ncbi:hypothetical protein JCM10212_004073 [Sporobolomyces blumeae]
MPPLPATLAFGAALRLVLSRTRLPDFLLHRNELVSPLSSWQRLQEGYHLSTKLALNPYAAGSFHAPPFLLAVLGPLTDRTLAPESLSFLVWTIADLAIAWSVARIADTRRRRDLSDGEREPRWSGTRVAALYLFHPFSIATTLARSNVVFANLCVALALEAALSGSLISSGILLSLATHLSLYPILLLPPLVVLANSLRPSSETRTTLRNNVVKGVGAFAAHQAFALSASRYLTGSWDFVSSVYGVILTIPDLTPNIGLAWYFFIEMFDHFRAFFLVVFALHPVVYVAPLTYFYRQDPLFAITLLVGSTTLLKSYPVLGDYALWHALLACYSEYLPHVSSPLFHSLLPVYALALLPTFHYLWLYSGAGNSNFFYASTLVWAVAMGGWFLEAMAARGRRGIGIALGKEARDKVRDGKWAVVQR